VTNSRRQWCAKGVSTRPESPRPARAACGERRARRSSQTEELGGGGAPRGRRRLWCALTQKQEPARGPGGLETPRTWQRRPRRGGEPSRRARASGAAAHRWRARSRNRWRRPHQNRRRRRVPDEPEGGRPAHTQKDLRGAMSDRRQTQQRSQSRAARPGRGARR
jgi:hypothetical protein